MASHYFMEKNKQQVIKEHISGGKTATLTQKNPLSWQGHPQLLQSGSSHSTVQPFTSFQEIYENALLYLPFLLAEI